MKYKGYVNKEFNCVVCNKVFKRVVVPHEERKFCSAKCRIKFHGGKNKKVDKLPKRVYNKLLQEYLVHGDEILDFIAFAIEKKYGEKRLPSEARS